MDCTYWHFTWLGGGQVNVTFFFRLASNCCAPESIKFLFGFCMSCLDFLCIHCWSHCKKIHLKFSMELSPTFLPFSKELCQSSWSYISCSYNPVTCRWIHCSNSKSDCVLVCATLKMCLAISPVSLIFLAAWDLMLPEFD